jgi:hypothetical protein
VKGEVREGENTVQREERNTGGKQKYREESGIQGEVGGRRKCRGM